MKAFYDELLTSLDGLKALRALNSRVSIADWIFKFRSAEMMLSYVFGEYVATDGRPDRRQERENEIAAELVRNSGYDIRAAFDRPTVRTQLADHRRWFDTTRERFLMLDLFPENNGRFQMSYDDCLRGRHTAALAAQE